jgi:WD40 repeat protein
MLFYKGSEGENYILSGGGLWDKTIKFWLYPALKCIYTFKGHKDCIYSLISLNVILKNHFASGSRDHTIKIWDLSNKECVKTLVGHTGCTM